MHTPHKSVSDTHRACTCKMYELTNAEPTPGNRGPQHLNPPSQSLPTCDGCWWLCVCAQGHPPGPLHLEGGSRDRALGGLVLRGQSLRTSRETGAGNGAFRGLAQHAPQASGARPPRSRVHSLPRAFVQGLRRSPCSASGDAGAAGTQRRLWPRPEAARGQTERRGVARQGFRPGSWLPPPGSTTGCRVQWPCPATSCPCGAFLP